MSKKNRKDNLYLNLNGDNNFDILSYGKMNRIKGIIIGSILSGMVLSGVGVIAAGLNANEVKYTPSSQNFTVTNAKDALDEIYKIAEYEIPADTYFYESGTEGEENTIIRYKKIDGEYYVCNENGIVAQGTFATDVTSKKLIPYTGALETNISAGTAGYANNSFILGNGNDNSDSYINGLGTRKYTIDYSNNGTPIICEYDIVNYKSVNISITGKYNNGYRPIYIYGDDVLLYSGAPSSVNLNLDITNYSTLKVSDTAQGPFWAGATIVITLVP